MRPQSQKRKEQTEVQAGSKGRLRLQIALNDSLQSQEVDDIPEDYEEDEEEEEPEPSPQPRPQRGRPRKIPITQPEVNYSPPPTPSKRRKRERELAAGHNKIQAESFVMKLFDRSLDLSKYTDQTALYPICRAWMANQPRNPSIRSYREARSPSPVQRKDNGGEILAQLRKGTNVKEVTSLPKPKKSDLPRLPPQQEPTKFTATEELIKSEDASHDTDREQLMTQHLSKWKRIKKDWQKYTKRYQQRNDVNFHILQELFKP